MQAAYYVKQGPAREVLQFGEQPTPVPGPGEVRVRVRVSGVNPSDWKSRGNARGTAMAVPLVIPHSDGAGDIDMAGPDVGGRVGERVWIWNGQYERPHGTAAEYIVVPSKLAAPLPDDVDYAEGACLGVPAFTAIQAVRLANLKPGMTILIVGGAGSVGHYAIQLAKLRGARVLTTVSSPDKAAHAAKAGADEAINYRSENVEERVKALTGGHGVDALIELDLTRNGKDYPKLLRPHATVVVYGMSANEATLPTHFLMRNSITLRLFRIYDISPADRDAGLAELGTLLEGNKLSHTVARRMALADIAAAHELGESGAVIGNIVLDVP
jgi:NADPH2:quinone reductase